VETIRRAISNVKGFEEPLHIVAHSYGGAVALCHACRYPGEIASLITGRSSSKWFQNLQMARRRSPNNVQHDCRKATAIQNRFGSLT
jgi:pimeloyl-ACP methyl ester carboxylesterase